MTTKYRNFTFTYNNYPSTDLVDEVPCKYILYGKEVGKEGTPHLQGTVTFQSQRTLPAVIKLLPGCHVEICRDLLASVEYCKKEGEFTERGTAPIAPKQKGEGEKRRWDEIRIAAEEGRDDDIPDDVRFNQYKAVEHFRSIGSKRRVLSDTVAQHLWYYGDAGTGKSRKAREENPSAYLKMCNKWWDGYDDEDVVLIEDFDRAHEKLAHHLKIWGDRYPFLAEIKGGAKKIRPTLIIVTSNYPPEEIWTSMGDLEPILRRFKKVHFKSLKSTPVVPIANLDSQMK